MLSGLWNLHSCLITVVFFFFHSFCFKVFAEIVSMDIPWCVHKSTHYLVLKACVKLLHDGDVASADCLQRCNFFVTLRPEKSIVVVLRSWNLSVRPQIAPNTMVWGQNVKKICNFGHRRIRGFINFEIGCHDAEAATCTSFFGFRYWNQTATRVVY